MKIDRHQRRYKEKATASCTLQEKYVILFLFKSQRRDINSKIKEFNLIGVDINISVYHSVIVAILTLLDL